MNICVFCGARDGVKREYRELARDLGRNIARKGHNLVYGGASIGLMGAVADGCLEEGGKVIGVMPAVLKNHEVSHEGLTELHWVDNMHQRKAFMEERADLFVCLPGGIGTLEEFFEQFTWHQLGVHKKPIVLVNYMSYYDLMIEFMQNVERAGFLSEGDIQRLHIVSNVQEILDLKIL